MRKDYYKKCGDLGRSAFHNAAASMQLVTNRDNQSTLSDSTVSETSVTESSLANNSEEPNHEGERNSSRLHFFDFLGVGSTQNSMIISSEVFDCSLAGSLIVVDFKYFYRLAVVVLVPI